MRDVPPFASEPMKVEPQWIDHNGHLNLAYYHVLFDRCQDAAFEVLGLGPAYTAARGFTTYAAEVHVCYLRQLHQDDTVTVSLRIVDRDEKRIHLFEELYHEDGWLSATAEMMMLHVDPAGPRVCPFPAEIMDNIDVMFARSRHLPKPKQLGRAVGISRAGGSNA